MLEIHSLAATLSAPHEHRDHRPRRKCIELLPRESLSKEVVCVCVYNIFSADAYWLLN